MTYLKVRTEPRSLRELCERADKLPAPAIYAFGAKCSRWELAARELLN